MNNKNKKVLLTIVISTLCLLTGCAEALREIAGLPERTTTTNTTITKNYTVDYNIFFYDEEGIKVKNTGLPETKLLIPFNSFLVESKVSPDNKNIAITYWDGDSVALKIINMQTLSIQKIHQVSDELVFTYEWAPNSMELAVGYYSSKKSKGMYIADKGGIFITDLFGVKRNAGCQISKKVLAWLPNNELVVSAGPPSTTIYFVSSENCSTFFALSIKNKKKLKFSFDGNYVMYYKNKLIYSARKRRNINVPELYVSDCRGKTPKMIADYNSNPKNAVWSPKSNIIAFDILSPDWSNIRHLAFYNIDDDNKTYYQYEDFRGFSSNIKPQWSPNGDYIAFMRTWERKHVHEIIYKSLYKDNFTILESVSLSMFSPDGYFIKWINNNSIAVNYPIGIRFFLEKPFTLSGNKRLIHAIKIK